MTQETWKVFLSFWVYLWCKCGWGSVLRPAQWPGGPLYNCHFSFQRGRHVQLYLTSLAPSWFSVADFQLLNSPGLSFHFPLGLCTLRGGTCQVPFHYHLRCLVSERSRVFVWNCSFKATEAGWSMSSQVDGWQKPQPYIPRSGWETQSPGLPSSSLVSDLWPIQQ